MTTTLLTRDDFRNGVFARDNNLCVVCGHEAYDAHHIIERRLWEDGGYYLDNGASVCPLCHIRAEKTLISVEELRRAAGITTVCVPECLYDDGVYDKWGNPILPDGTRLPGPLYYDTSVQKILRAGGVLNQFRTHWKYPRTLHLPWSGGKDQTSDEKEIPSLDKLAGGEIVVTEKMDGENTTMYSDFIHARSVESASHPSRSWVKNLHAQICADIPVGYRVCGENLYARHSIGYDDLDTYFMVFSVWHRDVCLSWDDTVEWAELLGLQTVPVLYRGAWNEKLLREFADALDTDRHEGYVVRRADGFFARDFPISVAKYVRPNHVTTSGHWMAGKVERNELRS